MLYNNIMKQVLINISAFNVKNENYNQNSKNQWEVKIKQKRLIRLLIWKYK